MHPCMWPCRARLSAMHPLALRNERLFDATSPCVWHPPCSPVVAGHMHHPADERGLQVAAAQEEVAAPRQGATVQRMEELQVSIARLLAVLSGSEAPGPAASVAAATAAGGSEGAEREAPVLQEQVLTAIKVRGRRQPPSDLASYGMMAAGDSVRACTTALVAALQLCRACACSAASRQPSAGPMHGADSQHLL